MIIWAIKALTFASNGSSFTYAMPIPDKSYETLNEESERSVMNV